MLSTERGRAPLGADFLVLVVANLLLAVVLPQVGTSPA